ncbi:MAG TPA: metal-dependent hydrolase [Nocardioidaceae bacterium]|nr:metal-dependent hydrolase [Nocardioidaceae bacterium]
MTAVQELTGSAGRYVKTRRIKFSFRSPDKIPKYFVDGDVAMSHLVAILSAGFPPGEEAFIRSVHHYNDRITDPTLKEQVKGFIGQEMSHGREHRNLNDTLQEMGYPVHAIDKGGEVLLPVLERFVPAQLPLALTAAAEHFTATLAARVLSEREYVDSVAHDEDVKGVLNWHAFEELEHKAVAFDVYRAMGGSEALRIGAMLVSLPGGVGFSLLGMVFSMALDADARRRPVHTTWRVLSLARNPLFKGILPELATYLRPGFHPDDVDTDPLLEASRDRLFGPQGELARHLA